jgi:hypothetical protein
VLRPTHRNHVANLLDVLVDQPGNDRFQPGSGETPGETLALGRSMLLVTAAASSGLAVRWRQESGSTRSLRGCRDP